jgi:glycosyltransferase involved in cell wall biosynthesis
VCDHLHEIGHEVHVLGLNYWGDPHDYPYDIWPCFAPLDDCRDAFGVERLPRLVARLRPDLVVLLNDPWNVPGYIKALDRIEGMELPPVMGWLAVDGKNQAAGELLGGLDHVAVWTEFAAEELRSSGYAGPLSIIPLGVDLDRFRPRDKAECRRAICPEGYEDGWIVGVVGRNQTRKRLDLTIRGFARWIQERGRDDARLLLHVAPTAEQGANIISLVRYYGLTGRAMLSEPHKGYGSNPDDVAKMYSAFDVYLTTTQGEGWGLPALEAMACGVPVVAPDWSGLGSWAKGAACLVPCSDTALTAPMNGKPYTIGGVVDEGMLVDALETLYSDRGAYNLRVHAGLDLARRYTWDRTRREFENLVASLDEQEVAV